MAAVDALEFGIFDQNDHGPYPLHQQCENRLKLIELYDACGFRTYHMSEHHATPLNLTPSPSVFLSAIAQRTRRLRFGALVYVLPAHHPLRLAEEICMLDHLSGGRVEVGIGRGASPHELAYWGIDPDGAQATYVEAYHVIMQALTRDAVNFAGKHYRFENVPIDLKPLQRPYPPLWYAVPVPEGADCRRRTASTSCAAGLCRACARSPSVIALHGSPPDIRANNLRCSALPALWWLMTATARRWRSAAAPGRCSTEAS